MTGQHAGPSLLELLWVELDAVVDRIMGDRATHGVGAEDSGDKGEAVGLAKAISIFLNPYHPQLDAVRAEAMRRWESRQAEAGGYMSAYEEPQG